MFPPEIFGEIFSFLASETRVLVACSQAHPIFAQLVEPTLYAHVIVHNCDADDEDGRHLKFKPYQLSTLLSDNPQILNYLRSLHVELTRLYSDDEAMKEMITTLPGLKLERIQLTFAQHGEWPCFSKAFHTAFIACISTSSMKEICLDGIYGIPLSSFADCAGLKRLTLCQKAVPLLNSSFQFPQLDALELSDWKMDGSSHGFVSWALTHASGLRSLTLATPKKRVICMLLPHLLAICSTSLVNLSIYYTRTASLRFGAAITGFDFPGLPNLERLHLCTYTSSFRYTRNYDDHLIHCALAAITPILQAFSSLKHLTLIVCLEFRDKDITQVDWSPLADFLSDRHSSFQHTDLHIRAVKAGDEVSSDEVTSMLSRYENLVGFVQAGFISIIGQKYRDEYVNRLFSDS